MESQRGPLVILAQAGIQSLGKGLLYARFRRHIAMAALWLTSP